MAISCHYLCIGLYLMIFLGFFMGGCDLRSHEDSKALATSIFLLTYTYTVQYDNKLIFFPLRPFFYKYNLIR